MSQLNLAPDEKIIAVFHPPKRAAFFSMIKNSPIKLIILFVLIYYAAVTYYTRTYYPEVRFQPPTAAEETAANASVEASKKLNQIKLKNEIVNLSESKKQMDVSLSLISENYKFVGKSNNVYADQELKKQMLNKELKNYFAPEFINRLDEIIVFNGLKDEDVKKIVLVEAGKLQKRLEHLKYDITLDSSVIDYIAKVGFDEVYGARPLKRALQEKVEDFVSDEVLKGNIKSDKKYTIKIDGETVTLEEEKTEKKSKGRKKKGE
jgi:ATP-dependent Clp protease ATP-binding subunit ClpA